MNDGAHERPSLRFSDLDDATFGADFPGGSAPVEYLRSYLADLKASSFVREEPYVDRHYLDDFGTYYSRSWRVPAARCARLHFWRELDAHALELAFRSAYTAKNAAKRRAVIDALQARYLGFVVRRPLKNAHIGRTVLTTYPKEGPRQYTVLRPYQVHIGGLALTIRGLAYQQQDRGSAVCASVALWSALQKVAHVAGHRTPTPSQITRASGSPFAASHGLDDREMAVALAALGYAADYLDAGGDSTLFRAKVGACLRSQLPVILSIVGPTGAHAVTLTGYHEPREAKLVRVVGDRTVSMRSGALEVVYAHDDNLGSHAHYELLDNPPEDCEGDVADAEYAPVWLYRGRRTRQPRWWTPDCCVVEAAIVPKPSKVRLSIDELFHIGAHLKPLLETAFPDTPLWHEVAFDTGVEYRQRMFEMPMYRRRLMAFHHRCALPRHLAVLSTYSENEHLCDVLLDATTVDLDPDGGSLLAIVAPGVPERSQAWRNLVGLAEGARVPMIGAPPTSSDADLA